MPIIDNLNSVRVFLRERPFLKSEFASPKKELSAKSGINYNISNSQVSFFSFVVFYCFLIFFVLFTSTWLNNLVFLNQIVVLDDKTFMFDHVFYSSSTQKDVYAITSKPILMKAISGYNGTIMAYGQSGSGKTFSCGLDPKVGIH
jgi:hypothetical protein